MKEKTPTRERLLAAARELFSAKGFGQTGVSEIIEQAVATSGSFYHFFPAKDDLLIAVIDHEAETIQSRVFARSEDGPNRSLGGVFLLFDYYRGVLIDSGFRVGSPTVLLASEVSVSHPEVRARLSANCEAQVGQVAGLFEDMKGLPDGLDRVALARMILASVEGAILQARTAQSIEPFDQIVEQVKLYIAILTGEGTDGISESATLRPSGASSSPDWKSW